MSIFDNPNVLKSCEALSDICDCITGKDKNYKREAELMYETLQKDFSGSLGTVLNAMEANRNAPLEAERLRKVQQEIETLRKQLEEELQRQKNITQNLTNNPQVGNTNIFSNPNIGQVAESLQQKLNELTNSINGTSSQPATLEKSQKQINSNANDFFSKMYGK